MALLPLFGRGMNPPLPADDISLTVSAKSQVVVGEQFRVVFTVNGEGKDFRGPDFKGFSLLSGPNTSSSFSTQLINGQISRTVSYAYTYYLLADQEGRFNVGSASISVDGKTYSSEPFTINVVKGQTQGRASGGSTQPKQSQPQAQSSTTTIGKDDIFLRVSVDNHSPWQGEQVIISYKIYTRRQISLPNAMVQPSLPGFWTEDLLKNEKQYRQTEENISGSKYIVVEYKRIAAFPQKSGELTIPAFEIEVAARVQTQRRTGDPFFDNFFGGSFFNSYQDIPVKIKSSPLSLKVKQLPLTGRPAGFSGAVGQYTFKGEADRESLSTNDALTLRYTISGSGNLMMIEDPQPIFPTDFEVYEPRISDNIQASRAGVSGSRSFEYIAIPRVPGSFGLKEMTFSYFDPASDRYKTVSVPAMKFEVVRGQGDEGAGTLSSVSQEEVKFIGSDIRFIKTGDTGLQSVSDGFFLSPAFYLLLLLPVILFVITLLLYKQRVKTMSDLGAIRRKRATRVARKHLRLAHTRLKGGNHEGYFEAISQAIWGYLGDRLNLPLSNLTMDNAEENLLANGVEAETIRELQSLIGDAEFARFAPNSAIEAREDMYQRALEVITRIENQIRK
jgi:hypothetical protein